MKRFKTIFILAGVFLLLSGLIYLIHYLIFRDAHHIFIYLLGDLGFLPLEVFIVVILIERFIAYREKQTMMKKLNMVIGAFFSEVGNNLLGNLLGSFNNREEISNNLNVAQNWNAKDFKQASKFAYHLRIDIDCHNIDLRGLKTFLANKRTFLLTLLENPNLLEHERFTDLLWAVTHLDEELEARPTFDNLPEKDLAHIAVDIQRLYDHLASEWLGYIEHLKSNYPFLFSLVLRMHPFQENPSPILT
ncbi:hypothetical protein ACFLWZ_04245 [Chloroflexota bacterium]